MDPLIQAHMGPPPPPPPLPKPPPGSKPIPSVTGKPPPAAPPHAPFAANPSTCWGDSIAWYVFERIHNSSYMMLTYIAIIA